MDTTIMAQFRQIFDRDFVLDAARRVGAVQRLRAVHPADFLLAVGSCALGDEERSIATARREFSRLSGFMPEESSFYDRFTQGMSNLSFHLFLRTLARANRVQRQAIAKMLGLHVRDVRAVDSTQVTLPKSAEPLYPSTNRGYGGIKLTATLSVLQDLLCSAHITDARRHDRTIVVLPDDLRGILWLMDRGYADHRLLGQIEDGGGLFLVRLRKASMPMVRTIRSGLAKAHRGKQLTEALPLHGIVDVDASFGIGRWRKRTFRAVAVPRVIEQRGQRALDYIFLATNLPPSVSADTIARLYRTRWCIETLFHVLKAVGRFDHLKTASPFVIDVFVTTTLLMLAFAQSIAALMRSVQPRVDPSVHRILALLIGHLRSLAVLHSFMAGRLLEPTFAQALWREGINPNPGRPYAYARHAVLDEKWP